MLIDHPVTKLSLTCVKQDTCVQLM